jgi:FHA domain
VNILNKARKLESKLAQTFDRAAQQWAKSGPREPLEVLHAILDAVEERLEPTGRGKTVFPFNRITISIAASSRDSRARFAAVFDSDPTLQDRVTQRLRDAGCDLPDLQIETTYVRRAASHWMKPEFHIEFNRASTTEPISKRASTPESLKLAVLDGSAERSTYTFALSRINLGRCTEVRDSRNRLVRTNHVVFADTQVEPNQTVSRRHAHISYVTDSGNYRVCDDRSAHGTSLIRNGKTVAVPPGSRGTRLESGDEIILGNARVRVSLRPNP